MVLESTIAKSRSIHFNKSLIRSLLRLRLQLKGNTLDSILIATRSITTSTGLQHISGQRNSRIDNTTSKTGNQTAIASSRNASIQGPTYNNYSTLNNSKGRPSNNNHRKNQKESNDMKAQAKNVIAALFFTSLIVEESYMVNRGKGVLRYDVAQLPSNSPIEDTRDEQIVQVPIEDPGKGAVVSDWLLFGVYDGHAGFNTSHKLKKELIAQIIGELTYAYKLNDEKKLRLTPDSDTIDQAIRSGFLKLDDKIVNKSVDELLSIQGNEIKSRASELLMPLLSGSCALVSFYDTNSKVLKVAVTGDSRALLGSLNSDNEWTVEQLSVDQTGSNPAELARIASEHPNEPDLIRRGRVLGSLEPSRSFGDARYKWAQNIQDRIYGQFFGRRLPANLKSPPYVTADPVITTTHIDPSTNKFLVMASDGLYEMLTNEEVVGLVVRWMENEKMIGSNNYNAKSFLSSLPSFSNDKLRLPKVISLKTTPDSPKQAFRRNNTEDVTYLMEDANVSTHLIRNALSNGGSKEHCEMLASIPSPLSRRYRDDLTVTVVFFGDDGEPNDAGKLELNLNGTNEKGGNIPPKPKL